MGIGVLLAVMKPLHLIGALAVSATSQAQIPMDPWFDAVREQRWCAWTEHSGPRPGLNHLAAWGQLDRVEAGVSSSILGIQAWSLVKIPLGRVPIQPQGSDAVHLAAGLGWDLNRMHVLARADWGPWTASVQPTRGRWSLTWRQLQTSGWTVTTHVEQDLTSLKTEWMLGLERRDLSLYASSLGRWRVVINRRRMQVALGGGHLLTTQLGTFGPAQP